MHLTCAMYRFPSRSKLYYRHQTPARCQYYSIASCTSSHPHLASCTGTWWPEIATEKVCSQMNLIPQTGISMFSFFPRFIACLCVCCVFWRKEWRTFFKSSQWVVHIFCLPSQFIRKLWTSQVAQWLRTCLPMQGTWVRPLVREDPTCRWATKPVCHNYWACAPQREATTMRSPCTTMKSRPRSLQLEKAHAQQRRPNAAINK